MKHIELSDYTMAAKVNQRPLKHEGEITIQYNETYTVTDLMRPQ